MKKIVSLILLISISVFAEKPRILMNSITSKAILIGTGPEKAYIFVDPMCPKSRAYLSLIGSRADLQEKKSYYIFLYRLKKFESDKLIQYIYQSKDPKVAIKEVMITENEVDLDSFIATQKTINHVKNISEVASQMNMKRRPYHLIFEVDSNYCRVSEGTAACLEEEDI